MSRKKETETFESIPTYELGKTPEDLDWFEYRLVIAKRLLRHGYEAESTVEAIESIPDLLADIRHLCDRLGLDYAQMDKDGYRSYIDDRGELEGEGRVP